MTKKEIPASIKETAFNCPHCGAYTTQYWYVLYGDLCEKNSVPMLPDERVKKRIAEDKNIPEEQRKRFINWCDRIISGLVHIQKRAESHYAWNDIENLNLSECYNCNKIAVWVHNVLLFPREKIGATPNPDLPEDIIRDYEEARGIIASSPRGAAALLRLCVQKLCIHLGENGKNIDDDIASLVSKGLNPLVQKSLDIVRVIGNEAVHPGVLDLKDDLDTANELLALINAIADQMVTHPKNVDKLYSKLPEDKRKAIEKRNIKSQSPTK